MEFVIRPFHPLHELKRLNEFPGSQAQTAAPAAAEKTHTLLSTSITAPSSIHSFPLFFYRSTFSPCNDSPCHSPALYREHLSLSSTLTLRPVARCTLATTNSNAAHLVSPVVLNLWSDLWRVPPQMDPVQKAVMTHTFGPPMVKTKRPVISCNVCQIRFNSEVGKLRKLQGFLLLILAS